jgi:hypothetical protein
LAARCTTVKERAECFAALRKSEAFPVKAGMISSGPDALFS